jgi:hypothetical protein
MDLRQQVIFAAQAADGHVKYDSSLVSALCRHVIEDEAVRAKLRPLLEKENTGDEQFMEKVSYAVSEEQTGLVSWVQDPRKQSRPPKSRVSAVKMGHYV